MLTLDRTSSIPFYQQVYEQLSEGIESGKFPAGKKLPSIRECARSLDVSNTTVELAYQRLADEGYVSARRGSGYTICAITTPETPTKQEFSKDYTAALQELINATAETNKKPAPSFDFNTGTVDATLFPFATWSRICHEVFMQENPVTACLYDDTQGLSKLREQIALYLASEHGIACVADQIVVMPSTRDLLGSILMLFDPATLSIAMENPGYNEIFKRFQHARLRLQLVPVNHIETFDDILPSLEGATVVLATPSSQFPSSISMTNEIRKSLVEWAEETGAYIIDDEYGWEFVTGSARQPVLATYDHSGHVITLGTFSNAFTPAICLSYAVLPPELMLRWRAAETGQRVRVPWQTQAAMASFMENDLWRTHIRRIRTAVLRKRTLVIETVEKVMGDKVDVAYGPSSLFVLLQTRDGRAEQELIEAARTRNVRVYPTSQYWHAEKPADWNYVLVGFTGIPEADIEPGLTALAEAWGL